MQVLKLWWMLSWRLMIVASLWSANVANSSPSSAMVGALGFSLVPALVIVLAARKSVHIFPIIRLIIRKPVIIDLDPERQSPAQQNPLLGPGVE